MRLFEVISSKGLRKAYYSLVDSYLDTIIPWYIILAKCFVKGKLFGMQVSEAGHTLPKLTMNALNSPLSKEEIKAIYPAIVARERRTTKVEFSEAIQSTDRIGKLVT